MHRYRVENIYNFNKRAIISNILNKIEIAHPAVISVFETIESLQKSIYV